MFLLPGVRDNHFNDHGVTADVINVSQDYLETLFVVEIHAGPYTRLVYTTLYKISHLHVQNKMILILTLSDRCNQFSRPRLDILNSML